MKISKYNLIFDHKDNQLAFNGMTCAFAKVDSDFLKILKKIESGEFDESKCSEKELELIKNMKKGGFIIDDCFDEIEFLKFKNLQGKFQTNTFSLTIAPTFSCNFACPYCYENAADSFMKQEIMDAICKEVEFAAKQKKKIHITWYGGEPLLCKNIIWSLSDKFMEYCTKYETDYSATIVTNGYLLDSHTIENFLKYKILNAQITIDGPADIHNQRRKLKNSSQPTFETILTNSKKALDAGIKIAIRINVDKTNEHRVTELLDTLLAYGLQKANVYLGHVQAATEFCQSISNNCLTTKEYALKLVDFERTLMKKRFTSDNRIYYYPKTKSNNCGADSITSRVIAPDGFMYKCWHDLSFPERSIGNITDPSNLSAQNIMTNVKYMLFNPFKVEKCRKCDVLPICMGGCPTVSNDVSCRNWKYSLIETLKHSYDVLNNSPKNQQNNISANSNN